MLACATFPLIWIGGLVTTTDAGMAFRDWLTSDGTFFLFYDWLSSAGDKFIEHGHRLFGALAGFLSILLTIVVWKFETRAWVKKFSLVILAAVILQGVLGGMRVVFDERVLALIHGCTGPLFFMLTVAMVVFTSRGWRDSESLRDNSAAKKLSRLAWLCTGLAYLQLMVGAVVRHSPHILSETAAQLFQIAVYFHIILAVALMGHVLSLAWRCVRSKLQSRGGLVLMFLVFMQIGLGISSWLVKYGMPAWATSTFGEFVWVNRADDFFQSAIITSHMATGSLILATGLVISLRVARQLRVNFFGVTSPAKTRAEVAV